MYKKFALFLFAAATTLSASLATARPPVCATECRMDYRECLDSGTAPVACRAALSACLASCN